MAQFEEILKDELDGYGRKSPKPKLSVEALRVPLSSIEAGSAETLRVGVGIDAAARLIEQPGTSCVMITDDKDRLVGLITERDLCTRVVAKGIEREEHLERALHLGCDLGQGNLLGRPARDMR